MQNDILVSLTRLSDAELVARLKSLTAREREATAQVVAHLAELDTRDVHLREGFGSLFVYCRDVLRFSEGEAYNRIEVARAARRFPVVLDMLASGAVTLTTVRLLAPHLTPANHRGVLDSARGKRKLEVQEIVASLSPRADVPASVRRLPAIRPDSPRHALQPPASEPLQASIADSAWDHAQPAGAQKSDVERAPLAFSPPPSAPAVEPRPATAPTPARPPVITSLSPDRYKLQLTISGETLEKLRLAKDMLSHALPSGDEGAVLDRALTALLNKLAREKFADTPTPRRARDVKAGARDVAARVKRAVWVRDLGRCALIGPNGHRCNERRFLEFHQRDPYALGGEATVDLTALRCRRHNNYEATLYFGKRPKAGGAGSVEEAAAPYGSGCGRAELVPEQVGLVPEQVGPVGVDFPATSGLPDSSA